MKISIVLDALTGKFDTDIQRSRKNLEREMKMIRQRLQSSARQFALYSVAATTAIAAIVERSADAAKELQVLSQQSNTNAEDFQRYAFAAKQAGIEQEKFGDILKDVNDRIGDFLNTGGGPMADFFEKIGPQVGVTIQHFKNLSGPQALQLYYDSLQKANLSQAEMTFYLEAMASDSTRLIPLLRDGGRAFAEQAEQADRLGLVISSIDVERLATLNNEFLQSAQIVKSISLNYAADLAPAIQLAIDQVEEFIARSGGVGDVSENAAARTVRAYAFVADAFNGVGRVFQLVSTIGIVTFESLRGIVLDFASAIINGPVNALNLLINQANRLPGVEFGTIDQSGLGANLEQMSKDSSVVVAQAQAEFERLLSTPLAGTQFMMDLQNFVASSPIKEIADDVDQLTESLDNNALSQQQLFELMEQGKRIFDETRTPLEKFNQQMELLNTLRDTLSAGNPIIDEETYARAVQMAQDQLDKLTNAANDSFFDMAEAAKQASRNIQDSLADFLFDPFQDGLDGMLENFTVMLQRMASQAAASEILTRLFGSQGGLEGAVGNVLGAVFGGAREGGGPVAANRAYLVGEKGPELFVPRSSGNVISNRDMGGGGGGNTYHLSMTVVTPDVQGFKRSQSQIEYDGSQMLRRMARNS